MKNLKKLAAFALILPVGAFAAGTVLADDQPRETAAQQGQSAAERPGRSTAEYDRSEAADRAVSESRSAMSGAARTAEYMTTTPDGAVRVDNVIGSTLHTQSGDEELGTISDLIIDESGQVVAVVTDVGGFLGMGQHSVAISWDSVERKVNDDRDGYLFSVNATEDALRDAPAYDEDSTGIRERSSSTN